MKKFLLILCGIIAFSISCSTSEPEAYQIAASCRHLADGVGYYDSFVGGTTHSMLAAFAPGDKIRIHVVPLTPALLGQPAVFAPLDSGLFYGQPTTLIHRIRGKVTGLDLYITQGDGNPTPDPSYLSAENFIGITERLSQPVIAP